MSKMVSMELYAARGEAAVGVTGMVPYLSNIPLTERPHNPHPSDATRGNQCRLRCVDVLLVVSATELRSQAYCGNSRWGQRSVQHTHHCVHLGPHAGEGFLIRNSHTLQHRYIGAMYGKRQFHQVDMCEAT